MAEPPEPRAVAASAAPWPVMRGNPQNTGRSPLESRFKLDGRAVLLSCKTGGTINATPVVGEGDTVYVGAADARFYVFDPSRDVCQTATFADDNPRVYKVSNIIDSAACIADADQVFFASGDFTIYRVAPNDPCPIPIDLKDRRVWSPSSIAWLEANVVKSRDGRLFAGCDNFYMYCVDPRLEGAAAVKWATLTGLFIWSACAFSPDESRVYFAAADCHAYALNALTGDVLWTHAVGNLCTSSPAVFDDTVMFGCFDGKVYGLRDAGGSAQRVWEYPTGSLIYASPAVAPDGTLLIASSDGVLRALDTRSVRDGRPRLKWEFFLGMPAFSSAAVGPDPQDPRSYLVYVGSGNGLLYALDPLGRRRWSFDTSTLETGEAGVDPAFWRDYRYPAINSSVALGCEGVATATSGGTLVYAGYPYYRQQPTPPGIDLRARDDDYDDLGDGPRFYYVSASGVMARRPQALLEPGKAFSGQPLTLRALARLDAPGIERSTFEPLDEGKGITVSLDGQPVPPDGDSSYYRLSADRTMVHVFPDLAPVGAAARRLEVKAVTGRGQPVAVTLEARLRAITRPPPLSALRGRKFTIKQMSVATPFVVPALDQVGIASISIPVTILDTASSDTSERFVAYGYESFAQGAANAPPRQLRYLFQGSYRAGNFVIEARNCFFELTAAPVSLDRLRLSGAVSGDEEPPFGVSLAAEYRPSIGTLLEWLRDYVERWRGRIPSKGGGQELLWIERAATLCKNLVFGHLIRQWGLLDSHDGFVWVGTYASARFEPSVGWTRKAAQLRRLDARTFEGTVTLTYTTAPPADAQDAVVGIVVYEPASQRPFFADYSNVEVSSTIEKLDKTLTITLTLDERPPSGGLAALMLELDAVASIPLA